MIWKSIGLSEKELVTEHRIKEMVQMQQFPDTHSQTNTYAHIYTHVHTLIHAYTHAHIYMYTLIHTQRETEMERYTHTQRTPVSPFHLSSVQQLSSFFGKSI